MRAVAIAEDRAAAMRATADSLPEKSRRQYLAREAKLIGYGGIAAVAAATGRDPKAISRGMDEIAAGDVCGPNDRQRLPGGGRHSIGRRFAEHARARGLPTDDLTEAIRETLGERCYGDPCETGLYTNVTAARLADEFEAAHGFRMSERTASRQVGEAGFSLQRNCKLDQVGEPHPLRDCQFLVREEVVGAFRHAGQPVASVDTKAKVKLGRFAAGGRELRRKGDPRRALDHDFALGWDQVYPQGNDLIPGEVAGGLAVAVPYGVYDLDENSMHVSIGVSADTSRFAANSLVAWWEACGASAHAGATELLVLADGGGSNRCAGWQYKYELALAAKRMGLASVTVLHLPAGASKWNYVEHRGWGPVSVSCAGKQMTDLETMASRYAATTNAGGLRVTCEIDYGVYVTGRQRAAALREAGLPCGPVDYRSLFDGVATIVRPFTNDYLSQLTYTIVPR